MSGTIEERLKAIEGRLRVREDVDEIRQVLGRYCKAIDSRDAAALACLLSREVRFTVVPWQVHVKGRDAVLEFFARYFVSEWVAPRHNCANEIITPDGNRYRSFCYFHETLTRGDESIIGWGTFDDSFAHEDGRWKIAERLVTIIALTPITRGWAIPDKIMGL